MISSAWFQTNTVQPEGPSGPLGYVVLEYTFFDRASSPVRSPQRRPWWLSGGWGTIDASKFVPALVAATRASGLARSARQEASRELSRLEHIIRLSAGNIPADGTSSVSGTGFLPRHLVSLAISGTTITTLTASDLGAVSYALDPAALGLAPGPHVLTLHSMLITTIADFRSR